MKFLRYQDRSKPRREAALDLVGYSPNGRKDMKNARKITIVALVCLNIGLLAMLVHFNTAKAYAQPFRTTNYVVVTTRVGSTDALCIIDLEKQKLVIWKWDKSNKRLLAIGRRELPRDFKTKTVR